MYIVLLFERRRTNTCTHTNTNTYLLKSLWKKIITLAVFGEENQVPEGYGSVTEFSLFMLLLLDF